MKFTVQQENSHLRNINTRLRKENEELRAGAGLDAYQEKCKQEAEQENHRLSTVIRSKDAEISRQQKTIDSLGKELNKAQRQAEECREKAEKAVEEKKVLTKKICTLSLQLQNKDKKIGRLEKENSEMQAQISSLNSQISKLNEKVQKLSDDNEKKDMQLNLNDGNSSTPSSKVRLGGKKVIVNSRKPSGKSLGGQNGHPGHSRNQDIKACGGGVRIVGKDDPLWNNKDYVFEGYSIKKVIAPAMVILEDIYLVPSFRNVYTGAHKQVECPQDLHNEMNYAPEYKASLLAATQKLNLGVQHAQDLINLMTHNAGSIPSLGFIAQLPVEFAMKTGSEQAAIYAKLLNVHAMHVDGTVIKVGRRRYNMVLLVSGSYTMYIFRPMKGKSSVKDTPIEQTTAILVHDHDIVYYSFGVGHQECMEHILRGLTHSIEVERDHVWAIEAKELIQNKIHAAKEADKKWREENPDEVPHSESDDFSENEDMKVHARFSEEMIAEYKEELMRITQKGLEEYERHPAKSWFKDGYNLCKRLHDDPDAYLLFLADDRVDSTNADAEIKARRVKRKMAVCMDFRGILGVVAYSQAQSVIDTYMSESKTTLGKMSDVFRRELTLQDKLRIKQALVFIYANALESDQNVLDRNEKAMERVKANYEESVNRLTATRQKYEEVISIRIEQSGKESAPSQEELNLKEKINAEQHEEFCAQLEIRALEKKISYDEHHMDNLRVQSERNNKEVAELLQRINSQPRNDSEKMEDAKEECRDSHNVLPEDETPDVQNARQKFEECQEKLNQAAKLREEKMAQYFNIEYAPKSLIDEVNPNGETNEEGRERAEKELKEAGEELHKAIEELQQAQKELDAARKGYKKRPYRKRGKGHQRAAEKAAEDDKQAV